MFNVIFESLKKIDKNNGIIKLSVTNDFLKMVLVNKNPKKEKLSRQDIIESIFSYHWMMTFFDLPQTKNKNFYKQIDLKFNQTRKGYSITFNFFKYWNIPQENTKDQLKEIIDFFKLSKRLLSTTQQVFKNNRIYYAGKIQINNEKIKGKTDFSIFVQNKNKETNHYEQINESTEILNTFINNNKTVHNLLLESAYKLNKVGRYAWINITPEQLGLYWKND